MALAYENPPYGQDLPYSALPWDHLERDLPQFRGYENGDLLSVELDSKEAEYEHQPYPEIDTEMSDRDLRHYTPSSSTESRLKSPMSSLSALNWRATVGQSNLDHYAVVSPEVPARSQLGRCPHPECGKTFKDLKAHMLTHQAERPEKCPIRTCEYHVKGFARKYDSNRHTLKHYKRDVVCDFCPGVGTSHQKSFNRADVLKRHLTSVHGVEQTPPNARGPKRTLANTGRKISNYCSDATGTCSICRIQFNSPQALYQHLDACILRAVQELEDDDTSKSENVGDVKQPQALAKDGGGRSSADTHGQNAEILPNESGNPSRKKVLTWSKGGVPLAGRIRKQRKKYLPSWGVSGDQISCKKRVLCSYDGLRRPRKDEAPLQEHLEALIAKFDSKIFGGAERLDVHVEDDHGPRSPEPVALGDMSCDRVSKISSKTTDLWPILRERYDPILFGTNSTADDLPTRPRLQGHHDCHEDKHSPRTSVTAPITHCRSKTRRARPTSSVKDAVLEDNQSEPAKTLQTVSQLGNVKTHDFAEEQDTPQLPMEVTNLTTSNSQNLCSGQKRSNGVRSVALSEKCGMTPSTTINDDCWQSQLGGDEPFESEGELSFMATPSPGDIQLEPDKQFASQRWDLQHRVAEHISLAYTTLLLRTRGTRAQHTDSSGASTATRSTSSGCESSQTIPSSPCSAKKRPCIDDEKDNDENDEPPRKRPSPRREYGAADDGKLLACPYSKYDPARYSERNTLEMQYRGCSSCFLTTVPRLKQHLYRVHSRPKHYCSCCCESFETGVLLDVHARARSCTVSPSPFDEKMTVDQQTEIKRRTPREERTKSWFAIYRILFPRASLPENPFIGTYSEECVEHFLSYFELEAPGLLANAIRSEVNVSALLLATEQRRMLDCILETALSRVVVSMTQAARERQQQRENEASCPDPFRITQIDFARRGNSFNPESSLRPPHVGVHLEYDHSDSSQHGLDTTQSWLMVNGQTDPQYDMCRFNVSMANSSINDSLPVSTTMPERGNSGDIDHDLAGEEWQRLLNAAPLEVWQDGSLYPENTPFASDQTMMSWFD